jgi:hypothetical protein
VLLLVGGTCPPSHASGPGGIGRTTAARDRSPVRTIAAGQTGAIRPGQWIVEQPSEVHRAADRGKGDVVILLATPFPDGAPPSVPDD